MRNDLCFLVLQFRILMALSWEDKGGRGKDGCALLGRGIRIHFCSHLSVFNQKLHVELLSRIFWGHQKFYWSHFSKVRTILHVLYFHSLFNQPIIHFTCQLDLRGKAQRQHCHFSSRTPGFESLHFREFGNFRASRNQRVARWS